MTTLCLCMIVKDEASVIGRCLASVRPILDHWLVVDTGSSDGTQAIVRQAMVGLPGELVERPWVDFAHNRSEALALARPHADYSLVIDADDELLLPPGYVLPTLNADGYAIGIDDAGTSYRRTQLFSNAKPWRYRGVLHEFPDCPGASAGDLPITMRRNHDGARRRDPGTYHRDAALLERALADEIDPFLVSRYTFYLAQSRRDYGDADGAIEAYLRRADQGFWIEEIYVSLLNAGRLMEARGHPSQAVLDILTRASALCPHRAEAAHAASRLCRLRERFIDGYDVALPALALDPPPASLFVEPWIYRYGLSDEFAVNAYWAQRYRPSLKQTLRALGAEGLPDGERPRLVANARFAADRLGDALRPSPAQGWVPERPLGGTELMVEGLRARIGERLEAFDLRINLYDPATRDARPLVVWFHHDVDQAAVQWCRDAELTAPVARFVFISHWQKERFVATFGLRPERCIVIRHAMEQTSDLRRWESAPVLRCAYVSTPFRGLDVLLDAWDRLPRGTAELHVWSSMKLYAGDDCPYQALLERARVTDGVVYHGLAPNHELRDALRTMHILAYPNTFAETACLSVMEAMAAGCRIIVPAHGALPETTGGYARLYPWCADKAAHAETFARVLAEEIAVPWQGRPDTGVAQQTHCATVFAWSRCLDEWNALIDDFVARAPSPPSPDRPVTPGTTSLAPVTLLPDGEAAAKLQQSLERLRHRGFAPAGILDVGAHDGAFAKAARSVFSASSIVMVEALAEKDAVLSQVAASLGNATHHIALLGDRIEAAVPFYVADTCARPDLVTTGASMFREASAFPMQERSVAMTTLADLLGADARRFPFVKLDVQGAELPVLRGLRARLCDVEVVFLELSLVAYNEGAPLLAAVTDELGAMGLVLHDLVDENRYVDGSLLQCDAIFVRRDSILRSRPPFWT